MILIVAKKLSILIIWLLLATNLALTPISLKAANIDVYYQNGDIIWIENQPYAVVANSNGIEVLRLTSADTFQKMAETLTLNKPTGIMTRVERNVPYVYAIAGFQLQKYDLSNFYQLKVVQYSDETSDYFYNISDLDSQNLLVTAGLNGVKVRDNLLGVVRTLTTETSYGLATANDDQIYISTSDQILSYRQNGEFLGSLVLPQGPLHSRAPYIDNLTAALYLPTSTSVKKISDNLITNSFAPITPDCYAVSGSQTDNYLYFTNGWGISKLDKNLKLIKARGTDINGGWAAGLKVVELPWGKRIVVFNGKNILLMNENLDILNNYEYTPMMSPENVNSGINYERYEIPSYAIFRAIAHGFLPGESVKIKYTNASNQEEFLDQTADNYGNIYLEKTFSDKLLGLFKVYVEGLFSRINFFRIFRII